MKNTKSPTKPRTPKPKHTQASLRVLLKGGRLLNQIDALQARYHAARGESNPTQMVDQRRNYKRTKTFLRDSLALARTRNQRAANRARYRSLIGEPKLAPIDLHAPPKSKLEFIMRMARKRVVPLAFRKPRLACPKCAAEWSPSLLPGAKLPTLYWQCPNRCNAPKSSPKTRKQ